MNSDLIDILQQRQARVAIGASSMRGRGNAGVVPRARAFLAELDLRAFGTSKRGSFESALDSATEALRRTLPRTARHWGLARKGLNIFLRECLYCTYTRDHFRLARGEAFYEVPLDSITARQLRTLDGRELPRWKGVRGVTPAMSGLYQAAAAREATKRGIARVHLDAIWWGPIDRAAGV